MNAWGVGGAVRWLVVLTLALGALSFGAPTAVAEEYCETDPEMMPVWQDLDVDEDGVVTIPEMQEYRAWLVTLDPTEYPDVEQAIASVDELIAAMETEGITGIRYVGCGEPTDEPTDEPTVAPTDDPTVVPTNEPTEEPTDEPTVVPTDQPTGEPTDEPVVVPTKAPVASGQTTVTTLPTTGYGSTADDSAPVILYGVIAAGLAIGAVAVRRHRRAA